MSPGFIASAGEAFHDLGRSADRLAMELVLFGVREEVQSAVALKVIGGKTPGTQHGR